MEWIVELETEDFAALLKPERISHPDPPREVNVIRYREVAKGVRTGRWLIVACRWTNDELLLGWPPLAITNDCEYGTLN